MADPHLSLGKIILEQPDICVQEARDTITGSRVYVISGSRSLSVLPNNHRILRKTESGALIVPSFSLRAEAPKPPAPVAEQPAVKHNAPKPAPSPPQQPGARSRTMPSLPKLPALPKLPRFTPYVLVGVFMLVVLLVFNMRQPPAAPTQRNAGTVAHLVDIAVSPSGLPPVRLVVESAPKGSGIEPGTVIGSVPKRVVFSHQGEWVVYGQYGDQISGSATITVPRDMRVTLVFPD